MEVNLLPRSCSLSTVEAEARELPQVGCQCGPHSKLQGFQGLYNKILSQKTKKEERKKLNSFNQF